MEMNGRTNELKAALYKAEQQKINDKWRQRFHLMPPVGWLNDPNGLCQLNGEYHIFFQYSPFDVKPGTNFWGHYTTRDFVNYSYLEPALCCDEDFDCSGVYSGSAYIENGRMYLYYTGNVKHKGDYDYIRAGREHNTILAESEDGIHFGEKQVLLRNSDYPSNESCHVRDPKVWKRGDEYLMLLGARRLDDTGELLLYSSLDKKHWELMSRIVTDEKFGYMWECPDYAEINGKKFVIFSPQGIEADGIRYNNVYQTGYCKLFGDMETGYCITDFDELDRGFDFYAPQSFIDEKGRRIQIGWMGVPDTEFGNPTTEYGWVHCLTIPYELKEKYGKIYRCPIEELKSLRIGRMDADKADIFEAEIENPNSDEFEVRIKNDCIIEYKDDILSLKFGKSGYGRDKRSVEIKEVNRLRIFCDSSSIEIIANDGEAVFSSRFYPQENERGISAPGMDMKVWELGKFNIN